jgi:hypothetical protein
MKGGLRQKNTSISSFQAVMNMINLPGAQLSHIAYKSLSGFIFKLDIPKNPDDSEFYGLNEKSHVFNVPIYSLIIKFAILSDVRGEQLQDLYIFDNNSTNHERYEKRKESLEDFKKECDIQQQVYLKTVIPSGNPVCLAVVDFAYFDSVSAPIFLENLFNIAITNKAQNMLAYLNDNVLNHRRLGMITMELADGYSEMVNVTNRNEFAEKMMYSISQLFISFTKLKIMNHDSHMGNILTKPNSAKTFHIDFGRTIDFNDGKQKLEDAFPTLGRQIIRDYNSISGNDYKTEFRAIMEINLTDLYVGGRTDEIIVIERMQRIIKFLAYVDYIVNTSYYDMTGMERPQMNEMLKIIYGGTHMSNVWDPKAPGYKPPYFILDQRSIPIYQEIIKLVERMSVVDTMLGRQSKSGNAIEEAKREHRLFSIEKNKSYNQSASIVSSVQSLVQTRKKASEEGLSNLQIILIVAVIGFILTKILKKGGSKSRSKSKSKSLRDSSEKLNQKITKIVIEKLKEYNCGLDMDLSNIDIKPVSEDKLNEYIENHEIEIVDNPEEEDECNINKLNMPPIKELLSHVRRQLNVNEQIRNRTTRKRSK